MQHLVTAAAMKEIDRRTTEEHGVAGPTLMENAGRAAVEALAAEFGPVAGRRVLLVCGKGNNGGDGFVMARLLAEKGAHADCILLAPLSAVGGDAKSAADRLTQSGGVIKTVSSAAEVEPLLHLADVVVDAIFGTGLASAPRGLDADIIRLVNSSGRPVVSVDVPSGVNASTGAAFDPAVRARLTVTMGLAKTGLWLYPGRELGGKVKVAGIGIPQSLLDAEPDAWLVDAEHVRTCLPRRRPDGHKGTFGTALVIAGSRGYSGAACLTAMAAVRSGCGLVKLAYPHGISDVVESACLEPVKLPLPQTAVETLSLNALDPTLEAVAEADAVAIGPGIGTHPETRRFTVELVEDMDKPFVLDADGINNVAGALDNWDCRRAPAVVTPHPGEFSRLTGLDPAEVNRDRVGHARAFSRKRGCTLLLKGASTVIAASDGRVFINPTGNSGLASGGTGDVLTGLICGLLAQGAAPLDAAVCGAYLHGLAADLAAEDKTEYSLCAGDLLDYLPWAFRQVLGRK